MIRVLDDERDVVKCGPGHDKVFADANDKVAKGCDEVAISIE